MSFWERASHSTAWYFFPPLYRLSIFSIGVSPWIRIWDSVTAILSQPSANFGSYSATIDSRAIHDLDGSRVRAGDLLFDELTSVDLGNPGRRKGRSEGGSIK
jgi:hypothetical protein